MNSDRTERLSLNRALTTYTRSSDPGRINFALSLNQLAPQQDWKAFCDAISYYIQDKRYQLTSNGAALVFILGHDGLDWSKFYGSDAIAHANIAEMRRIVLQKTGREIAFVLMNYDLVSAHDAAKRYGLDFTSTYTNFAPGKGATPAQFDECMKQSKRLWQRAKQLDIPYIPNITLGWDNRPRKTPAVNIRHSPQGPWCERPTAEDLRQYFRDASQPPDSGQTKSGFRTIVVYAWNEFTEGGWMAPTEGDLPSWMNDLRIAIGRNRALTDVELSWPSTLSVSNCPMSRQ